MPTKALCHAVSPSATHTWLSPATALPVTCGLCVAASRLRTGSQSPLPACLPPLLQPPGLGHRQSPPSPGPGGPGPGGEEPPCRRMTSLSRAYSLLQWVPFLTGITPTLLVWPFLWMASPSYTPSASQLCPEDLPQPLAWAWPSTPLCRRSPARQASVPPRRRP